MKVHTTLGKPSLILANATIIDGITILAEFRALTKLCQNATHGLVNIAQVCCVRSVTVSCASPHMCTPEATPMYTPTATALDATSDD